MMEASLSWRHAKAQRWAQGCKMGRDGALPARRLLNKANKLLRDGTVEGAKKAYAQLKSIQGEVGNDRAMRNHMANCIGVCADAMIKLDAIAADLTVCPTAVLEAAEEATEMCRAALLAAAEQIPIDAAREKINAACATLDEIKTTADTWVAHSALHGAQCAVGGAWVYRDGDEMKDRRAKKNERYAKNKGVPNARYASLATTQGQIVAVADRRSQNNSRTTLRDEAARAAAMQAFSEAGLERQPRNVAWRLVEGLTVEFKVQSRPMPPDELNPWSSDLKAVIKREQRFYEEAQRFYERAPDHNDAVSFDLTKRLAEDPDLYVNPAYASDGKGNQGKFCVFVHPKGKFHAPDRRYSDSGNGTKWFDREEDAIAKKFAWYRAGFPGAWFCKKKSKKRGRS